MPLQFTVECTRHICGQEYAKASKPKASTKTIVAKKPAGSTVQSRSLGQSTNGWEEFAIVPYTDNSKDTTGFEHLTISKDMKKAPAVVKHIQNGTLSSSAGCMSVKDFLKSLENNGDSSWLQEWNKAHHMNHHDRKRAILERLKMELDQKNLLTVQHKLSS